MCIKEYEVGSRFFYVSTCSQFELFVVFLKFGHKNSSMILFTGSIDLVLSKCRVIVHVYRDF